MKTLFMTLVALAATTMITSAGNLFLPSELGTTLTTRKTVDGAGNWWQMSYSGENFYTIGSGGTLEVLAPQWDSIVGQGDATIGFLTIEAGGTWDFSNASGGGARLIIGNTSGTDGAVVVKGGVWDGSGLTQLEIGRQGGGGSIAILAGTVNWGAKPLFSSEAGSAGVIDFPAGSTGILTISGADQAYYQGLFAAMHLTYNNSHAGSFSDYFVVAGETLSLIQSSVVLYWDPGDTGNGGAGDWNLTSLNWESPPGASPNRAWTPNDGSLRASLGGTGSVVTLTTNIVADKVTISSGGYSFSGSGSLTANEIAAVQDIEISAPLAGSGVLRKSGAGTLNLTGTSSGFTGTLDIREGRSNITGNLTGSVIVGDTASIGGEGTIGGNMILGATGGATLKIDSESAAALSTTNLTLNGVSYIDVTTNSSAGVPIALIHYSGITTPAGPDLTSRFTTSTGNHFTVTASAGTVWLTLGVPENITWNNAGGSGRWSLGNALGDNNWNSTDGYFFLGDHVTFGDTASGTVILNDLKGGLQPASVTFRNTAGHDYFLHGSGIRGQGPLLLDGNGVNSGGRVTLTQENAFTGGVTVNRGTLELEDPDGDAEGVVRGTVTVNGPGILKLLNQNELGYVGGIKVDTLNVMDGGLVDHVGFGDNGWNITWNLRGSTITSANSVGLDQYVARFVLGAGSVVNSLASANTSEIAGLVRLREANPDDRAPFNVENGPAYTDLLVSAKLEAAGTPRGITKNGAGLMRLSGTNNYDFLNVVNAGILIFDKPASFSGGGVLVAAAAGVGVLAPNFTDTQIANLLGTVNWDPAGTSKLVIETGGGTATVGANLAGNYILLAKGGGTLNLTGTVPATIESEDGTVINVGGGVTGIAVDSITTAPGSTSGIKVTIAFAATGNGGIDVWSSPDLLGPGSLVGTIESSASPFIHDNVADPRRFYILVPQGAGDPFPAP